MQYPARAFRWSPDGKHAAAAGGKGERAVLIWDMATRAVVNSLSHHTAIISLSWSPAGTQIALVRAPSFQTHRPHTMRLVLTHGAGSAVRGGQVLLMGRDQSGSAGQGPGALTAAAFAAIVVIVANRRRGGDHRYTAGRGATGRPR